MARQTVTLFNRPMTVDVVRYPAGGQLGLQFYDTDGMPYGRPTAAIPEEPIGFNQAWIKDYNEYAGWYQRLEAAGIVKVVRPFHPALSCEAVLVDVLLPDLPAVPTSGSVKGLKR